MKKTLIGAGIVTLALSGTALAGGHAGNPAVKARQAHMQLYSFNAGYFFGLARGNVEYNAEAAQGAADNLLALAQMNQGRMWPQGTDNASIDGTRALPALWKNFPKVMEISASFREAAANLAAVAGTGEDAAKAAVGGIGQACQACHEAFRAPDN